MLRTADRLRSCTIRPGSPAARQAARRAWGDATFSGELETLRSHEVALQLITEAVKAVIRSVLTEPRLVLDLREC
jgi:hypothetical protein